MHLYYEKLPGAYDPIRATRFSAGLDLAIPESVGIGPGETIQIDTKIKILIPSNVYARICGRSGNYLAGLSVFDGVVDPDFEGTIKILVTNNWATTQNFIVKGERLAQLILQPFILPVLAEVKNIKEDLSDFTIKETADTKRGDGGFGSTGIF